MTAFSLSLLDPVESCLPVSAHWYETHKADRQALALYLRHYSAAKNRGKTHTPDYTWGFTPPGDVMVLLTANADALFVWSIERFRGDGQEGINCNVFRNESQVLSSLLIREAVAAAWARWHWRRLFTFVDSGQIRSTNPGYCFLKAGWRPCGYSDSGKIILEVLA